MASRASWILLIKASFGDDYCLRHPPQTKRRKVEPSGFQHSKEQFKWDVSIYNNPGFNSQLALNWLREQPWCAPGKSRGVARTAPRFHASLSARRRSLGTEKPGSGLIDSQALRSLGVVYRRCLRRWSSTASLMVSRICAKRSTLYWQGCVETRSCSSDSSACTRRASRLSSKPMVGQLTIEPWIVIYGKIPLELLFRMVKTACLYLLLFGLWIKGGGG